MFNISYIDKLLFTEHLSLMIKAGLSLKEGVSSIAEQTRSLRFKKILKKIIQRLENGESLGKSLGFYPRVFNNFFVNMVIVGEESGTLDENLNYLAQQLKKNNRIKRKVIAAMIYPAIVLVSTFCLAAALTIFIFPKLIPLFKGLRIELPLSAKILLFISETAQNYGLFIFLGIIGIFLFLIGISRLRPIKKINHFFLLRIPVVGKMVIYFNLAVFTRNLAVLIKSGLPIVQALDITAETLGNLSYQAKVKKLCSEVKKGKQMSSYLNKEKRLFPPTFFRMIEVGEKTGNLENSLFYLADFAEQELDDVSQRLSSVLEPILLIIIGLVVGFVALAIITPIYQITQGLSNQ